jgi:hypothetical protein
MDLLDGVLFSQHCIWVLLFEHCELLLEPLCGCRSLTVSHCLAADAVVWGVGQRMTATRRFTDDQDCCKAECGQAGRVDRASVWGETAQDSATAGGSWRGSKRDWVLKSG